MTAEGDKLRAILDRIHQDVENVKKAMAAPQLGHSSVDTDSSPGYIPFFKGDVEVMRIGRQPDGTMTAVSKNNTDPPRIPRDPFCEPFFNGVQVTCNGFSGEQYLDFSHVNVYCDGVKVATINKIPGSTVIAPLTPEVHSFKLTSVNLSETESPFSNTVNATPLLVVGTDITDGIISELKLANDAVTEAKIAANAVTGTKIVAETIQALHIAAEAISADKLAANSVTADKIQALAITSAKIAANAIQAGHIQAGSIDATKLTAQIAMATLAFICGDPVGQRLVIDSTGLNQYDANGRQTASFGANPNGGNFLTIPDSNGDVLASLDSGGILAVRGLNVADPELDSFRINGDSFYEVLDSLPRGIVARSKLTTYNQTTTSETGVAELRFDLKANRQYRVVASSLVINPGTNGAGEMRLRRTNDGTRPLLSGTPAPVVAYSGQAQHSVEQVYIDQIFNSDTDFTWWGLVTIATLNSGSAIQGVLIDAYGFNFYVEDLGMAPDLTGGPTNGLGSNANAQRMSKTYNADWTRTLMPLVNGGQYFNSAYLLQGMHTYQGVSGQGYGYIGFPYNTIASDLASATVNRVELYLQSSGTYLSTGAIAEIGTHGFASAPAGSTAPPVPSPYGQCQPNFTSGAARWVDIPQISLAPTAGINIWDQLKNATRGGFCLDSGYRGQGDGSRSGDFFGVDSSIPVAYQPKLRITYTK